VVYQADNLDLHVNRALKFLPPHTAASDQDRVRLERETEIAPGESLTSVAQLAVMVDDLDRAFGYHGKGYKNRYFHLK